MYRMSRSFPCACAQGRGIEQLRLSSTACISAAQSSGHTKTHRTSRRELEYKFSTKRWAYRVRPLTTAPSSTVEAPCCLSISRTASYMPAQKKVCCGQRGIAQGSKSLPVALAHSIAHACATGYVVWTGSRCIRTQISACPSHARHCTCQKTEGALWTGVLHKDPCSQDDCRSCTQYRSCATGGVLQTGVAKKTGVARNTISSPVPLRHGMYVMFFQFNL